MIASRVSRALFCQSEAGRSEAFLFIEDGSGYAFPGYAFADHASGSTDKGNDPQSYAAAWEGGGPYASYPTSPWWQ